MTADEYHRERLQVARAMHEDVQDQLVTALKKIAELEAELEARKDNGPG